MKLTKRTYPISIMGQNGPYKLDVDGWVIEGIPFAVRNYRGRWAPDHLPTGHGTTGIGSASTRAESVRITLDLYRYGKRIGLKWNRSDMKRVATKAQLAKIKAWRKLNGY